MENNNTVSSRRSWAFRIKIIIPFILGGLFFILAKYLLRADFFYFMKWWAALLLLGIAFLPLVQKVFCHFHDNGYLFSKIIGLAVCGYLMWLLSSLKLLKFTSAACAAVVLICVLLNLMWFVMSKPKQKNKMFTSSGIKAMISEELLFLIILIIWTYIRGFKPEAYGTEKFMDFGFMAAMMRSDYMPPKDMWFAGSTINYYYVGQYMAVFMTKLSTVTVNAGYNLMLMTLAAFAFVLPFSLVYNVTANFLKEKEIIHKKSPCIAGILSGAGVSLAGNMHFTLFYWVIPAIRNRFFIKDSEAKYWFPDSTRYIGYNPDTRDKTIHEFPSYSFVLGDLHAHVINIIFVLTVLGILFAWLLGRKKFMEKLLKEEIRVRSLLVRELFNPYLILIGFFIGLFHTTNFWDFPVYYVVAGAVILFSNLVVYSANSRVYSKKSTSILLNPLCITAFEGIMVMVTAKLAALPFILNFDQISTQIKLAVSHTPLYQLIILWGLPVSLIAGLIFELITKYREKQRLISEIPVTAKEKNQRMNKNSIINFLSFLNISELFVLIIGLCGIGLVLIPEFIYVKDIYSGDYKRANTMFKLTYQAFILFGVSCGFIFLKFMKVRRYKWQKKFIIITFILFLSSLWYTKVSVGAWYGNIFIQQDYKGLDAQAYLEKKMPDDFAAVHWLNNNVKGTSVILEANGDSYSDYGRISSATGLPTVLGWYVHEWLWRGDTGILNKRADDIEKIYTAPDLNLVSTLIEKYRIEYVYVGKLERDKYGNINDELIKSLGKLVYISPETEDKPYESYIVQIKI